MPGDHQCKRTKGWVFSRQDRAGQLVREARPSQPRVVRRRLEVRLPRRVELQVDDIGVRVLGGIVPDAPPLTISSVCMGHRLLTRLC